jgi:hypothetical protein
VADTNELNQSELEDDASESDSPVQPQSPDLEAIVRSVLGDTLKSELDSRFSGLQSIQDKRLAQLARELRASNLTQDQQEAIMEQEQEKETEKALRIAELIKRRKAAPEAVDFLIESMEKADLDEQVEYIQSVLNARTATQTPVPAAPKGAEDEDEGEIPESTKNNPPSNRNVALESGEEMTEELADAVLSQVQGRGQLSRFFGRR